LSASSCLLPLVCFLLSASSCLLPLVCCLLSAASCLMVLLIWSPRPPGSAILRNRRQLCILDFVFKFVHHRITLSALANTRGGIASRSCFAVFRLMIRSNLVGCSTGRSAGLAPFKILSTNVAAPAHNARRSDPYESKPPASRNSFESETVRKRFLLPVPRFADPGQCW
jgi:hypothetical protein